MRLLAGVLASGLGLGAVYALFALGYSLVYGILRLMNLAHGDVLVLGLFVGLGLLGAGVPGWAAVPAGVLTGGALAVVVDQAAYRPLRQIDDRLGQLLAALAVALLFRNLTTLAFGVKTRTLNTPWGDGMVSLGGVAVPLVPLAALAVALMLLAGFSLFLQRSRWGWAIQAAAQDFPTARLMGIPAARTVALIYLLAGVVGMLGGWLYASVYAVVYVGLGFQVTLKAFTAAVLGGIGSLSGAVLGGLLLGIVESMVAVYVSSEYRDAISFALFITVLLFRPQGLFRRRDVTRV